MRYKYMGTVVDDEYWKAVEEMPSGSGKYKHYLFGCEPTLSILIKNNKIKNYQKLANNLPKLLRGNK